MFEIQASSPNRNQIENLIKYSKWATQGCFLNFKPEIQILGFQLG